MGRDEVLRTLSEHMNEIRQKFAVETLAMFGSTARGEARPDSDLDILVTYVTTPGLFGYLELKAFLETLLRQPVDLVTEKALKRQLRDRILRDAVHVH